MFDGIFEAISDTIRSILFGPLGAVLNWIIDIVKIILTEISGFSFIDLEFITTCYNTCVTIALIILPLKLVYEWMWLVISNEAEKWSNKVFAVFQITVILLATPPILTQVGTAVTSINSAILSGEVVSGESSTSGDEAGKGFAISMLAATTGLSSDEAKSFIEDFTGDEFDINKRDDDDNYVYDFDFIMPLFIGTVMWVIIFFIGLQMASRQVSLAFFKIITPLCALSLTNKENPTAFTVWKNNVIGAFLMNIVQIFLFLFMFKLLDGLGTETSGIAKLLFIIALLLVIIAIPNKVASMIGGYNAGIMEGLAGMQQTLMMLSSGITAGHVIKAGVGATGHAVKGGAKMLANAPKNIASKTGGAASKVAGVADSVKSSASRVQDAMKYGGGVAGGAAILASDALHSGKDKVKGRVGGLGQEFKRGKREADVKAAFGGKNPLVVGDGVPPRRSDSSGISDVKDKHSDLHKSSAGPSMEKGKASDNRFQKINTTNRLNKQRANKERRLK